LVGKRVSISIRYVKRPPKRLSGGLLLIDGAFVSMIHHNHS
jgi:hypothetical protein